MRCLKCWTEIHGEVAIFTKSCYHVFCERCSGKAFKKELSCPLCDTVLAKDGVGELVLRPDESHIKKMSAKLFGLEPDKLCEVLQLGLDFWVKQKQNESIQHVQELRNMKIRLEDSEAQAQKLSKALEDEKLKKNSLQNEKHALQRHVSELETRYAEKARSMRKLNELYSELRQIHRRLESDLRGVRDTPEYEPEELERSEIEVQTLAKPVHRAGSRPDHNNERGERKEASNLECSERISFQGGNYDESRRARKSHPRNPRTPSISHSAPLETLFTLAPNQQPRPFALNRRVSQETGKNRRRRDPSA